MKLSNYERVKKWRAENKAKHKLQWERYYLENHELILQRKRNKYKLDKQNEPTEQDIT